MEESRRHSGEGCVWDCTISPHSHRSVARTPLTSCWVVLETNVSRGGTLGISGRNWGSSVWIGLLSERRGCSMGSALELVGRIIGWYRFPDGIGICTR